MSYQYIDLRNLRSESDIKTAKEKLKYNILVQEDMLSKSINNLRTNLLNYVKRSIMEMGTRILITFLLRQLKSRLTK